MSDYKYDCLEMMRQVTECLGQAAVVQPQGSPYRVQQPAFTFCFRQKSATSQTNSSFQTAWFTTGTAVNVESCVKDEVGAIEWLLIKTSNLPGEEWQWAQ
ncbi:unnamed protein product [Pleuronectes platessa]|uniref:Uncharacterized protein n=1 Tax=Pleuronectes platessa TaxID=8262 RepID=A0A9N7Z5G5_PLEPL|nr:unnamed protein product [Pleuronectes platessa]